MTVLSFSQAMPAYFPALAALAARSFTATFGHLYTRENLDTHLTTQCSEDYFRTALDEGESVILVKNGETLIGYAKVGRVRLPVTTPIPPGAVEFHRVYIDAPYQGHGFGKKLMLHLLSLPQSQHAPVIYLGVWEENLKAQALYKQYGFEQVGRYLYHVGTQSDRELIMARTQVG